jgi:hypothetical protein
MADERVQLVGFCPDPLLSLLLLIFHVIKVLVKTILYLYNFPIIFYP